MSQDFTLFFVRDMLYQAFLIAMPLLVAIFTTSFLVSILQVITQIQDTSLSTISKLLTVGITLFYTGSWMLQHLILFAHQIIHHIPEQFS